MTRPAHALRTAIVPAAGLGTRLLPATKTVPKETLPVMDTPAIDLVVAEAAQAGAERLLLVGSPRKRAFVEQYGGPLAVQAVIQRQPRGLGDAVACVESELSDEDDAVFILLPDALLVPAGVLATMAKVRNECGGSVLCAMEVSPQKISAYGVLDVGAESVDVLRVRGIVEKPRAEDAPSWFAVAGRYLLDRRIFDALRRTDIGADGELQLTDAIALLIEEGHPVRAVIHRGHHHDLGNPIGYLEASIDAALDSDSYGPELRRWLVDRLHASTSLN